MARAPRVILKDKLYEIIPRAREGLPLPPTKTTNTILKGILARTQRDNKVTLCNLMTMNNHEHIQVIPDKAEMLPRFYCEFQKKVTDSVRTLLGRKSLRLWEDRTGVIQLEDLDDAIGRLVYIFCNPSKAGLVDRVEEYPGLSSWDAFVTCPASVEAEVRLKVSWHPVATLPRLPRSRVLTEREDELFSTSLDSSEGGQPHELVIKPLAWLKLFGISEAKEIEGIRQEIIERVRDKEAQYREERRQRGQRCIGAERLRRQPYMQAHSPKEKLRKIFLICGDKARRIELLEFFARVFERCRECYQLVKQGVQAQWPPGTFIPWVPPALCCVEAECEL